MKHNNEKWIANYKKVVAMTKQQPSSGIVCALATLITVRDAVIDDQCGSDASKRTSETQDLAESLKENFDELVKELTGENAPDLKGFASNASAAAKAAGFASVGRIQLVGLEDLLK